MLVSELTSYQILERKVIENLAGEDGTAANAAQNVTKGKADVVEAEFEYSKSSDGNKLLLKTDELMRQILISICSYAEVLGYCLPMCTIKTTIVKPPFKTYKSS